MTDTNLHIRRAVVFANFLCLGFSLAHWATAWFSTIRTINSQASILILLGFCTACAFGAKAFLRLLDKISLKHADWVIISTFIFAAGAANVVFSPFSAPDLFFVLPFALWAVFFWFPELAGLPGHGLERFVTILCQILALALVLKISSSFALSVVFGAFAWGCCFFLFWRLCGKKDGHADSALAILSPILILWFFVNLSNQLVNCYPGASRFFLYVAAVSCVAMIGAGLAIGRKRFGYARIANRVCMGFFAASLVMDIDVASALSTPLHLFDVHWWLHVALGLELLYANMKPFIQYAPVEGAIWATWLPRLWFVFLDNSSAGYLVLFAFLSFASNLLYMLLLYLMLLWAVKINRFASALVAVLLVITNIPPLQDSFPFPGGWCIAQRAQMLFVSCIFFLVFWQKQDKGWEKSPKTAWIMAFLLGAVHGFGFFYETLMGLGCLAGLYGAMIFAPSKIRHKKAIALGTFAIVISYPIIFQVSLEKFFLTQPIILINQGHEFLDTTGTINIFAIFSRNLILSTFHYSMGLAVFAVFLGMLPFSVRKHKVFTLALYMFGASFFMYISGGQRFFGVPDGMCGTVHFVALSSLLIIPLILCIIRMAADSPLAAGIPKGLILKIALCGAVLLFCVDGVFYGRAPAVKPQLSGHEYVATDWDKRDDYLANHSFGAPTVIRYYFQHKSRQAVAGGPKPLPIHFEPYSTWENNPGIKKALMRIMVMGIFQSYGGRPNDI